MFVLVFRWLTALSYFWLTLKIIQSMNTYFVLSIHYSQVLIRELTFFKLFHVFLASLSCFGLEHKNYFCIQIKLVKRRLLCRPVHSDIRCGDKAVSRAVIYGTKPRNSCDKHWTSSSFVSTVSISRIKANSSVAVNN